MKITKGSIGYVTEPLLKPFGFKGGYVSDVWQVVVSIGNDEHMATGLSIQSVLWSDGQVFASLGQLAGDKLMYDTTKFALSYLQTIEFEHPKQATRMLFEKCYEHVKITTKIDVKKTFILNALVAIDMALWLLYAKEKGVTSFTKLTGLEKKHNKVASIPLITYTTTTDEIREMLNNGQFFLKIKIGNNYEWDKQRIMEIYQLTKEIDCPYTTTEKPILYLDANGRYENYDKLASLINYLDIKGILPDVGLFEEPFSEEKQIDISLLPCIFACDESAHSVKEVKERYEQGYKAIALKPVAKTLSESLEMLEFAISMGMKPFVADLTVNPFLLELNRNIACRIDTLDSVSVGLLETNGDMNYTNWEKMITYHPLKKEGFQVAKNGVFIMDDYEKNDGGIFLNSSYYDSVPKEVIKNG
ncbi:MAG: hypothetical protein KAG94_00495 [Clostridiales bacterium]|nr:hypothetical protein [Clostridiales bacterium]